MTYTVNTGYLSPSADGADSGGDGDGYEDNPGSAYSPGGGTAGDATSGTNTVLSCSDSGKDRHQFYNYGISVSAESSIDGIEVRLDAAVSDAVGEDYICAELSWDGGGTWTAAKSTGSLSASIATYLLGSPTDTWGRTWDGGGDFTNSNFRVRLTNVSDDSSERFDLDWVAVKVHYTEPTPTATSTPTSAPTATSTPTNTPPATATPASCLDFNAGFDADSDGFLYVDDTFRGSNQPAYADGTYEPTGGFSGGGVRVVLGGLDSADILDMSGGWSRDFTLAFDQTITLDLRYRLILAENYEADEFGEALLSIDGTLIGIGANDYLAHLVGNGTGGGDDDTGW